MNKQFSFKFGRFIVLCAAFTLLAAACVKKSAQPVQTPTASIDSISIDGGYKDGDYTMYTEGAVVKVAAKNVQSVEIKYHDHSDPNSLKSLGQATSLSSQQYTWALQLPKDIWAQGFWAEAVDTAGNVLKSQDLGNVRYEMLNSYTSPDKYGFAFNYSGNFSFSTDVNQVRSLSYIPACSENMLACAYLGKEDYPGTNFEAAGVSVSVYSALNSESKCYNFAVSTNEAQTPGADANLNGVVFKTATGGGGAAGHFDIVKVYRNFHNGSCFEVSRDIVGTNPGVYGPDQVDQFDQAAVEANLERVVQTFRFTK